MTEDQFFRWSVAHNPSGRAKSLSFEDQWQNYRENYQNRLPVAEPPVSPAVETRGEPIPRTTRNIDTAAVRAEESLPPIEPEPGLSLTEHKATWQEAAPPSPVVDSLADLIVDKGEPYNLSAAETQGFERRIKEVTDARDQLIEDAKKLPDGSVELQANLDARKKFRDQIDKLTQATHLAGTAWSYTGLSRQNPLARLLEEEMSPTAMESRMEEAKGRHLTPEEVKGVHADAAEVKAAVERAEKVRKIETSRRANQMIRSGRSRYSKMTEAEKDAELVELKAKAKDPATKPEDLDKLYYNMAMNLGSRPGVRGVSDVAVRLQSEFDGINRYSLSDAIVNATQKATRDVDETTLLLQALRKEFRTDKRLRTAIDNVLWHRREGTVPEPERKLRNETEDIRVLREILDYETKQLREGEPAQIQRKTKILAALQAKLANGDFTMRVKAEKPLRSVALEQLDYKISQARQELRQHIARAYDLKRKFKEHPFQVSTQWLREIQAWKSSVDMSALRKQGGIYAVSHPIKTLRALPQALRAVFDPVKAHAIQNEIFNGERAWWYKRAGLEFTEYEGGLNAREEAFAGNLIERVPGIKHLVKGSNRGFVTLLNLMRKDSFDAMERAFSSKGGLSLEDAKGLAYFVNVMTGRGSMAGLEKHAATLNGALWSPRYTLSRFQYLGLFPLLQRKISWQMRARIAGEYARYLGGVAALMFLYEHVFGGKVEQDPRSADFGKIVIGNTRLDPLSGLSQVSVLLSRMATGQTKTQRGQVVSLSPSSTDFPYRGDTRGSILLRFGRSKLGFAPGLAMNVITGKSFIGEPITLGGEAGRAFVPLAFEDVLKLMQDQGMPKGSALEVLNLFGEGVQTYTPRPGKLRAMSRRRRLRRRPE
jgi:hypothetical protein